MKRVQSTFFQQKKVKRVKKLENFLRRRCMRAFKKNLDQLLPIAWSFALVKRERALAELCSALPEVAAGYSNSAPVEHSASECCRSILLQTTQDGYVPCHLFIEQAATA